tara:strand:+ start:352 stop:507 length:156 start_codon:yes stop_codon:yes gene_type:complete
MWKVQKTLYVKIRCSDEKVWEEVLDEIETLIEMMNSANKSIVIDRIDDVNE